MNFDFSDDQHAIKRTAKDLLAHRFKMERVRELAEAGEYDEGVWKELCELGWAGIFIDESYGGQGLGIVELIILMEELGYALAPLPFLSNAAAGLVLQAAARTSRRQRGRPASPRASCRDGGAGRRRGQVVPADATAEVIVLCGHEGTAKVVERPTPGIEPVRTMDPTRAFARVARTAPAGRSRATTCRDSRAPPLPWPRSSPASRSGRWRWQSNMRARPQAVRPGDRAYQAVSHRCAQMLMEVEGARSATYDGVDRGRRAAGVAPRSRAAWRRPTRQTPAGGFARRRCRCTRDWLHLGARPALLPQTGQGRRVLYGSAREHRDAVADLSAVAEPLSVG